jgi:DNA-binding CsgD family transcriptional regulator
MMDGIWEKLSARELKVLDLASRGLIDLAIAAELGISISTVRSYWSRIRSKMGVVGRPELVARHVRAVTRRRMDAFQAEDEATFLQARSETDRALTEERMATDLLLDLTPVDRQAAIQNLRMRADVARAEARNKEDIQRQQRRTAL